MYSSKSEVLENDLHNEIKRSVSIGNNLEFTKKLLEAKFETKFDDWHFKIEDYYLDSLKQHWLQDAAKLITDNIPPSHILKILETLKTLNNFDDCYKFSFGLGFIINERVTLPPLLYTYIFLLKELCRTCSKLKSHEKMYVSQFRDECVLLLRYKARDIDKECKFFKILLDMLKSSKAPEKLCQSLGILTTNMPDLENEVNFKNILDILLKSQNAEVSSKVKQAAKQLIDQNEFILSKQINDTISSFLKPITVKQTKVDERHLLKVLGSHIVVSKVLAEIEKLLENSPVEEVHLFATVIHIDTDLSPRIWHGKNIIVLAETAIISDDKSITWDVSGNDAPPPYGPLAGTRSKGWGLPGADGGNGESGGNIFIKVDELTNGHNFRVISNGGNGGNGQDGGNGEHGEDGFDLKENQFKELFPPVSKFRDIEKVKNLNIMKDSVIRNFQSLDEFYVGRTKLPPMCKDDFEDFLNSQIENVGDFYFKLRCDNGCKITFSFYYGPRLFTFCQSFLLHEGSPGEQGKPGGTGGKEGVEGFAGDIDIEVSNNSYSNYTLTRANGKEGMPGKLGMSGSPGKKGADRAYKDFSTGPKWPKYVIPKEKDNQKLHILYSQNKNSDNVFTAHNNLYADIVMKENEFKESKTYDTSTNNGHKERTMLEKRAQRKKTICKESIINQYEQKMFRTELFKFDNLLKNVDSLFHESNLLDETIEKESEHISTEIKIIQIVTYSGKKRVKPDTLLWEKDPRHVLDEKPYDSLNKIPADEIIELVKNDPSLDNCIKLLKIRLDLSQVQCLWEVSLMNCVNNLLPNDKFNDLEIGFCNKFQLAALEYFATKFEISDYDSISKSNTNSFVAPTFMSLDSFNKLFTVKEEHKLHSSQVDEYFLRNTEENRRDVLEQFLNLLNNPLGSIDIYNAMSVVIVNEFLSHYNKELNMIRGINVLIDLQKKRLSNKFDCFKNAIRREKDQTIYNDLLRGIVEDNNHSLVRFENEIGNDQFLSTLYNSFIRTAQQQKLEDLEENIYPEEIYTYLSECFLNCGPFSFMCREFLAYHHGINILVYSINDNNKVVMTENHNPKSTSSVHFLLKENKYLPLNVNKDFAAMINNHHSKSILFNSVQIYIDSLNMKEICEILSKQPCTLDLNNDVCGDKSLRMHIKLKHIFMENVNIKKILKYYHLDEEKEILSCILEKLRLEYTGCSVILDNVALHFENEGTHISSKELIFVLNFVLKCSLNVPHVLPLLTWVLAAYSQNQWLLETILLKLELNLQKTLNLPLKSKWRKYLSKHNQKDMLMLIMEKICEEDVDFNEQKFEETIYLLSKIPQNHLGLDKVPLDEWKYYLKDKFWSQQLRELGYCPVDNDKLKSVSYYLMVLENLVGIEICEKLVGILKTHEAELYEPSTISILPDIFRTIANKEVCLDDSLLKMLEESSTSEWINVIKQKCFSSGVERTVPKLIEAIKISGNTSKEVLEKLDCIAESVERCNIAIKTLDAHFQNELGLKKFISKLVGDHSDIKCSFLEQLKSGIKKISITDESFENLFRSLIEIYSTQNMTVTNKLNKGIGFVDNLASDKSKEILLAAIVIAIKVIYKKTLRDTQIITVLSMLQSNKNVLCQVATGEGKSLIVVAVAIIKVLTGQQKVDIITSSRVLATRDAEEYKDLYELFGIHVGHNCSESIEERKQVYSNNRIVYGELANFQRDFLLDRIHNHNILGDRQFKTIIIDEVDSMLVDKGNNTLYLSHEIPGLDKLESVFIYIWKALHIPAESGQLKFELIVSVLKNKILHDLFGIVTKEDLRCLDTNLGHKEIHNTWQFLLKEKIIDSTGKVLKELGDQPNSLPENCVHEDHLKYLFKNVSERMKCLEIPNYLKQFVEKHLETWIVSGIKAMTMEPGVDYVVDIDRSESSCDRSPNIMIVDQDTGTDLVNSQWENGLHQFLQIKHGCRLTLITLKAVFISNVSFLMKYESLYGLTGTLGSQMERELLQELYKVDYVTIPTAKTKSFIEEVPIVCSNTAEWIDTICSEVCKKTDSRSVLIVCETVNVVKTLQQKFIEFSSERRKHYKQIHTYTRDYEELSIAKSLEPGHIIISTNLAGRGTDIKLTKDLIDAGGLHVCLSYLPGNSRIEEQAFGRAARNGELGSGQMIVNSCANNSISKIIQLKYQRDVNEMFRISEIKKYYDSHIKLEEVCFDEFQNVYKSISISNHPDDIKSILLQTSLDQWAYWLEENTNYLNVENVKDFLKEISALTKTDFTDWSSNVKDPFQMIKLGLVLIEKGKLKESILLFEKVIKEEPHFSESAYYYKLMAITKKKDISDKKKIFEDLNLVLTQLKERVKNYSIQAHTVDYLKKKSPRSVLQIESFKEQQLNIANIYNVFLQSIYDIIGYEISVDEFGLLHDMNDKEIASRVFSDLIKKKVVKEPTIKNTILDKDFPFAIKYGIDAKEMSRFFQNYEEITFNETEHLELLKSEFCNVPSRESFWSELVNENILIDEKQYCIVDLHKLHDVDPSLINYVETLKETNIKQGNEIWLYQPKEIDCTEDNHIIVKRAVLVGRIGEPKFIFLLKKSIIYVNHCATFMQPNNNVEFKDFDLLRITDFLKLGISLDTASKIIDELKKKQVIKEKQGTDGYMLSTNYSDKMNIELFSFKAYSDDVIKLLNYCFTFRIALQKLCILRVDQVQNYDALYRLPIRIHCSIIRDLYDHEIISKHVINPSEDVSEVLKDLYPKAMTEKEYRTLFDGLYDSSTINEIINSLISNKYLEKQHFCDKYVIEPKHPLDLPPHLECQKNTIQLVLERQRILTEEKTKKQIEQIIKDHSSMLHNIDTPAFDVKSLSHKLEETQIPVSESKMFSLNGFDKILVLEEKKFTMKMMLRTCGVALIGVAQVAVGVYMQLFLLNPLGATFIAEGLSDISYAVTCCFSGRFSWRDFSINKVMSLILSACSMLNPLSKFKSMFGQNVSGASVLSSQKSECTSMLGKAANFIKNVFKPSSTQAKINKTVMVKMLAKQVVTHSALGCSIGMTYGVINTYLQPELEKLSEELVERCSVDIFDVASENLLENIEEVYLLLGPKEAVRTIRMCYSSVIQKCRGNSTNNCKFLMGKLSTIIDNETRNCFQECKNKITLMNAGNAVVSEVVKQFEQNLTKKLKELRKIHSKTSVDDCEAKKFADEILNNLGTEVKTIVTDNIKNNIISPLLCVLNTTCVKYFSNMAAEKCFDFLKEENVMEIMKCNEEMYTTMEFGQDKQYEKKSFYHREYNDYLLEVVKRKRSLPVFRELLENNYSIDRVCIELCCSVIPMALKQGGLDIPMLRVIVDKNGNQRVYGGCSGSEKEVLTVTIADNLETNIKENKVLIRSLFDSVYKTVLECYPEYKWLTSDVLHKLVINAIEKDFYIQNFFRNFDTSKSTYTDDESNDNTYTCFQKTDGNTHIDTTMDESSSHVWPNMDVRQSLNSESDIKDATNTKDVKMNVIKSFKAALEKINSHLYKTQPYLKSFSLTLEDFAETSHVVIPSHENVPGRYFDYYATDYELVMPFFAQTDCEQYADYIVKMTLGSKKHSYLNDSVEHMDLNGSVEPMDLNSGNQSYICYSVEPKDQLGRLDWGIKGSILLDVECGNNVYTVKDCHIV